MCACDTSVWGSMCVMGLCALWMSACMNIAGGTLQASPATQLATRQAR